jgi:hypothetical protein
MAGKMLTATKSAQVSKVMRFYLALIGKALRMDGG